jgi:DNA-binding transcriptional LysR family regulator
VADLARHRVVHYSPGLRGERPTFEVPDGAGGYREIPVRSVVTVNNVDAYKAACLAGLGIIQVPRYGVAAQLASGELLEVLPTETAAPMPVSLVHAHGRNVPRRARVVMSWIAQVLTPNLAGA